MPSVSGQRGRRNTFSTPLSDMRMILAVLGERAAAEGRKCRAVTTRCERTNRRPSWRDPPQSIAKFQQRRLIHNTGQVDHPRSVKNSPGRRGTWRRAASAHEPEGSWRPGKLGLPSPWSPASSFELEPSATVRKVEKSMSSSRPMWSRSARVQATAVAGTSLTLRQGRGAGSATPADHRPDRLTERAPL
jgi:hypothetical protein